MAAPAGPLAGVVQIKVASPAYCGEQDPSNMLVEQFLNRTGVPPRGTETGTGRSGDFDVCADY